MTFASRRTGTGGSASSSRMSAIAQPAGIGVLRLAQRLRVINTAPIIEANTTAGGQQADAAIPSPPQARDQRQDARRDADAGAIVISVVR